MNEITNHPEPAAWHSLSWNETFLWYLPALPLTQTEKIFHANPNKTINSEYDHGVEKQTFVTPQWRYPVIVVYKRLAYLPATFYPYSMVFNLPRRIMLWHLAASYSQAKKPYIASFLNNINQ